MCAPGHGVPPVRRCAWWPLLSRLFFLLALTCLSSAEEAPPFSEYLFAPLRVHLWRSATETSLATTLTLPDVERVLARVNRVWAPAGIGFLLESLVEESPLPGPPPHDLPDEEGWLPLHVDPTHFDTSLFHVYFLKRFGVNGICYPRTIFVQDTASLRPVTGGLDEPLPRVTAHELGHALGLPHRQAIYNLMASGNSGAALSEEEIRLARRHAAADPRFVRGPELLRQALTAPAELAPRCRVLPLETETLRPLREAFPAAP